MPHWKLPLPENNQTPVQCDFPIALLSGFAAYTTFRLPIKKTGFQAHFERLKHDAFFLGLDWPYTHDALYEQIISISTQDEPVIRLTAYADISHFAELFQPHLSCHLLLSSRSTPPLTKTPLKLKTVAYTRAFPTVKLTGIGEIIHLKRIAVQEGYQDILLTNHNGHITEASTANFFAIDSSGTIHTANPERDGCLPGITRRQILELIEQYDFSTSSEALPKSRIQTYSGAFLTNAVQGLVSIQQIDQYTLPWPKETQLLFEKLQNTWN
jgi:branched-subunit amino acid aminotransferase/4-amino-4-deoxychorismate lyase